MQQNDANKRILTPAQLRALPIVAAETNTSKAARTSGVSRATLLRWLAVPVFRDELQRQRQALAQAAFSSIRTHIEAAVGCLRALLSCKSLSVRRGAARDILDLSVRVTELQDISARLDAVERALADGRAS